MAAPTVALIHATPTSMPPAHTAFAERFPDARLWNLLDDRLITEADAAGGLTPALGQRMAALIRYAVGGGADAVQLTCSMYGPVTQDGDWAVPVHASDAAMFTRIRADRPHRVAVLGPLSTGVADTTRRLREFLGGAGVRVEGVVVEGAAAASRADDHAQLRDLVVDAARRAAPEVDMIVLGQYSISLVHAAVSAAVPVPVLSPPHLAADTLRDVLTGGQPR
ncbi:hypothetical protein KZZ52_43075 [Dactylosporangium sp. AC04546]|uniref:aspartate/glutamate racemase family protein n=1 Tax=Dactylosporangium sp. AC04546 TaxID=2862460 RepID=UPI001EDD34B4|nr:hypothetical protein [Dactylosporangium sp. AC04546]WVK80696.1 hypothetical protein KZZ52_43075 [Dactylosporangium sp. AC04546]